MELNQIDAPPQATYFNPDAPPPKPSLQRQTSVKLTNMQQMGSVRQIGQYRPELARPHNMTNEQAAAVEARRRQEATQTHAQGDGPLSQNAPLTHEQVT